MVQIFKAFTSASELLAKEEYFVTSLLGLWWIDLLCCKIIICQLYYFTQVGQFSAVCACWLLTGQVNVKTNLKSAME